MTAPRSPFLRILLWIAATLLLCLAIYVGLGWVVWTRQPWLAYSPLGPVRFARLDSAYACALGSAFSKDSDLDGFTDGIELWHRTNPRDPTSLPPTTVLEILGFRAYDADLGPSGSIIALQPGERRHIRARVGAKFQRAVFGSNTQLRVRLEPEKSGRICAPGGTPSDEPFLVPVSADGVIEFDLALPPEAESWIVGDFASVVVSHPVSNLDLTELRFTSTWRGAALECQVEKQPNAHDGWSQVRLTWRGAPERLFVEATRDESEAQWVIVGYGMGRQPPSMTVAYLLTDADPRFHRPLKFRVVPALPSPPQRVPEEAPAPAR